MTEVATERIIMTGRTEPFVQSVAVVADAPLVRVVEPQTAQVSVPVSAEIGPHPPATTDTASTSTSMSTSQTDTSSTEGTHKRP